MTRVRVAAEPSDGQFVVWYDHRGDPECVYWRADRYAETDGGEDRWVQADQSGDDGSDGDPWTWTQLCADRAGLDGPYLLALGGRL